MKRMSHQPKNTINLKECGELTTAAIRLESDFQEMERLGRSLSELTTGTITNLEHAQKLLAKFSEVGLRIGEEMQALAAALNAGRIRAEDASQMVAKSAELIQARQNEKNTITERFAALAGRAQAISASLSEAQAEAQDGSGSKSPNLADLEKRLSDLASDAETIKNEAQSSGFKDLGKDADAMLQTVRSTLKKIRKLADQLN
jgi:hypothetical protein